MPDPKSRIPYLLLALTAAAGILLALYTIATFGAGVSKDAVQYLAAARSLIEPDTQGQLLGLDGEIYILWPPFYPMTLAALEVLTDSFPSPLGGGELAQRRGEGSILQAAGVLNALLFGLTILLGGLIASFSLFPSPSGRGELAQRRGEGFLWPTLTALALLLSPPLYGIAINVLSDLLFIVLCLLFLLAAGRWLDLAVRGDFRGILLVAMALLTGLACLTRYIGFVLIALGLLAILVGRLRAPLTALREAAAFTLLSILPLLAWMARNQLLTGLPFGERGAARWTLAENLTNMSAGLNDWFLPLGASLWLLLLAGLILLAALLSRQTAPQKGLPALLKILRGPYAWPALAFGALYLPALLASQMSTSVTRIDERLLAPAYFPLALLITLVLAWAVPILLRRLPPLPLGLIIAALLAAWLLPPALRIAQRSRDSRADGVAIHNYLNARAYHESPVTHYLTAHPLPRGARIYSNLAAVVYLYANHRAESSPFRHNPSDRDHPIPIETYAGVWPAPGESYLVWYDNAPFEHYYLPADLRHLAALEPLYEGPGGGIYRIAK